MIERLKNPGRAAQIFSGWEETMIWSCLEGVMGEIFADDMEEPACAMALLADFAFYGGKVSKELVRFLLRENERTELVRFWPKENERTEILMVPQNEEWARAIEAVHGKRAKRVIRYSLKKEPDIFDREKLYLAAGSLDTGIFTLKQIDREIYTYVKEHDWCRDWVAQFDTFEQYEKLGLGVAVLKDGVPVAGASSYTRYQNGIEIQIDTHPDYRRRGLGYACGAKLILKCLERGLYPSWDAQNLWSLKLAEKLGYRRGGEYAAYEVKLLPQGEA